MRLIGDNLACTRGERLVFSGVSFSLEAGRALILSGPNGSGKSTLLRLIAGLLQPDTGAVRLEGGDRDRTIGEACHYLAHADAVKPALTVEENLQFWVRFYGGGGVAKALGRLRLDHLNDLPAGLLSAGQKRRLALARLLLAARPVWLLDEPTVALDQRSRDDLGSVMAEHLAGGGLIVAATHMPLALDGAGELALGQGAG